MKEIIITEKEANQRLDKFLLKYFDKAPKSFVYKMLRKKRIKYNRQKGDGSEILQKGDSLQMYISDETTSDLQESRKLSEDTSISFKKLYEDKNILVVNKPAGVLSQKETADTKNSLIEQAIFYLWEKGEYEEGSSFTPALCNRLDRNTSGIVIIGKSVTALQEIGKMLQNGNVSRYYLCLVKGQIKFKENLRAYLVKDSATNTVTVSDKQTPNSQEIFTKIEPVASNERYTFLEVNLMTGRPHQIRAHLAFIGHPVIGDKKYGHKGTNMTFIRKYELNRQFLHCHRIAFDNIEGDFAYLNGYEIFSELPDDLDEIVESIFPNV